MHRKPTPKYASRQAFVARQRQRGRISGFRRRMKTLERDRHIVAARRRGLPYKEIARRFGLSPSTIHNICGRAPIYRRWRQWLNAQEFAAKQAIRRTSTVIQKTASFLGSLREVWEKEEDRKGEWRPPDDDRPAFIAPPLTLAEAHPRARA